MIIFRFFFAIIMILLFAIGIILAAMIAFYILMWMIAIVSKLLSLVFPGLKPVHKEVKSLIKHWHKVLMTDPDKK